MSRYYRTSKRKSFGTIGILIVVIILAIVFIPELQHIAMLSAFGVLGLFIMILTIYISTKLILSHKRKILNLNAEPYYINSQCPHCYHQWNRVKYYKGEKPQGAIVICDRCGNKYKHKR